MDASSVRCPQPYASNVRAYKSRQSTSASPVSSHCFSVNLSPPRYSGPVFLLRVQLSDRRSQHTVSGVARATPHVPSPSATPSVCTERARPSSPVGTDDSSVPSAAMPAPGQRVTRRAPHRTVASVAPRWPAETSADGTPRRLASCVSPPWWLDW